MTVPIHTTATPYPAQCCRCPLHFTKLFRHARTQLIVQRSLHGSRVSGCQDADLGVVGDKEGEAAYLGHKVVQGGQGNGQAIMS